MLISSLRIIYTTFHMRNPMTYGNISYGFSWQVNLIKCSMTYTHISCPNVNIFIMYETTTFFQKDVTLHMWFIHELLISCFLNHSIIWDIKKIQLIICLNYIIITISFMINLYMIIFQGLYLIHYTYITHTHTHN